MFCFFFSLPDDHDSPFAGLHGCLNGTRQALQRLITGSYFHGIHQQFNVMHFKAVELHPKFQIPDLPVDPDFEVSLATHLLKIFAIMPFPATDDRCQDHDIFIHVCILKQAKYLFFRILDHLFTAHIGIGTRHSGIQQAKKIIDLSNRTYCGPGILIN